MVGGRAAAPTRLSGPPDGAGDRGDPSALPGQAAAHPRRHRGQEAPAAELLRRTCSAADRMDSLLISLIRSSGRSVERLDETFGKPPGVVERRSLWTWNLTRGKPPENVFIPRSVSKRPALFECLKKSHLKKKSLNFISTAANSFHLLVLNHRNLS